MAHVPLHEQAYREAKTYWLDQFALGADTLDVESATDFYAKKWLSRPDVYILHEIQAVHIARTALDSVLDQPAR